jgi:hypothetical protein
LAQARLQRALQLLVDGGAHLFELGGVVVLQRLEPGLERGAHLGHALLVVSGERRQLLALLLAGAGEGEAHLLAALAGILGETLGKALQAGVGARGEAVQALAEALDALGLLVRHPAQLLGDVAAEAVETLLQFLAAGALFLAQRALQALAVALERIQADGEAIVGAAAAQQHHLQREDGQGEQEHEGEEYVGEGHGRFRQATGPVYAQRSQLPRRRGFNRRRRKRRVARSRARGSPAQVSVIARCRLPSRQPSNTSGWM